MRLSKRSFIRGGLIAASLATALSAMAQTYPDRPLRWLVGYPAGGGSDRAVRVIAAKLGERLGQPIVVENRPGAGTVIAAEAAARSAPDGYTLFSADNGTMIFNPLMKKNLPYHPERDFAPVALYGKFPFVLTVNAQKMPVNSVRELIDKSKAQGIEYASPGVGSPQHLAGELFKERTGAALNHVAYKGTAPLTQDLLGGHIGVSFLGAITAIPQIKSGALRAIAVPETARLRDLPDVPTMAEAGVPDLIVFAWQGVFVPAKTPAPIVKRLSAELDAILQQRETQEELRGIGVEQLTGGPEQVTELMRSDLRTWADVIRKRNISLD